MGKHKKSGNQDTAVKLIVLVTALVKLVEALIGMIKKLIE